jgi:histidyl-tRNA synthetase
MSRRNYIFDTIRRVFGKYCFQQIETPAMENLSTLMGKYGEEGDKLLFKILNSGEWTAPLADKDLADMSAARAATLVSEKGLRYDLTVPFARYVVQNHDKLQFPFRRYQIQPVWRADRPQKGRYREFYQCDVDVVGTNSLLAELELIQIVEEVFCNLGIRVCLKLNNRKLLAGIAQQVGAPDKLVDLTVAIDKLDKIGLDKVNAELLDRGLTQEAVDKLQPILALSGTNSEKLDKIDTLLADSQIGQKGVEELRYLFSLIEKAEVKLDIELDLSLARGLNYYTGAIFEVKALDVAMGSITGGGRYDNLTGIFGMPGLSGVGISFGADRIYDVLTELNLFLDGKYQGQTRLLFAVFGEQEQLYAIGWAKQARRHGINTEIYPEAVKMKRQLSYADQKQIPFVAVVGADEMAQDKVMLKNMATGEQQLVSFD